MLLEAIIDIMNNVWDEMIISIREDPGGERSRQRHMS